MQSVTIVLFFATSLGLILTPGPDMIYVLTRGIGQGRRTALISASGICSGYVVHTALAVFGLTALIQSSATLFHVLRYAGAAYLVYLGIRMLLSRSSMVMDAPTNATTARAVYLQGIVTSVSNPKGILFFMAFLPQFVTPSIGHIAWQICLFGVLWTLMCLCVHGTVGFFSGSVGDRLRRKPTLATLVQRTTGCILVGLGVRLVRES